ncbi:type II secretion system protein [Geosporobacter ferrireducens]|uniref:Prepilin-type N-terminal cleavage/methylation domain-containing protein n=1 Tax=Geosporobacter ferrireducens TaxID=1424294 RepID=A0A1D8GBA3_9FIRM|nr:type II secretion system protein [Geosporobacter ferrireducens]AOT68182.1 hypothetical protein Gferi_00435 [Geosporobacter ferrireducens]
MIKMFTKRMKNRKGFTLIELIVVIAILGIISLVAVPRLSNLQNNARIDADRTTARQIVNMTKVYIADKNLTNSDSTAVTVTKLVEAGLLETIPKTQMTDTNFTIQVTVVAAVTGVPEHLKFVVKDTATSAEVIYDSSVTTAPYGATGKYRKSNDPAVTPTT